MSLSVLPAEHSKRERHDGEGAVAVAEPGWRDDKITAVWRAKRGTGGYVVCGHEEPLHAFQRASNPDVVS